MTGDTEKDVRRLLLPTDDVRWRAQVMALDRNEAVPLLAAILNDAGETDVTRHMAATMLGMLRDERAIGDLSRALDASNAVLRARAAEALGQFENLEQSIIQRIITGLKDQDYFVREWCAKALGQLKREEAIPALRRMSLDDTVSTNRDVALQAIDEIQREA